MQNTSFDNEADYSDDLDFTSAPEAESCVNLTVPLELAGGRLDAVLAKLMPLVVGVIALRLLTFG